MKWAKEATFLTHLPLINLRQILIRRKRYVRKQETKRSVTNHLWVLFLIVGSVMVLHRQTIYQASISNCMSTHARFYVVTLHTNRNYYSSQFFKILRFRTDDRLRLPKPERFELPATGIKKEKMKYANWNIAKHKLVDTANEPSVPSYSYSVKYDHNFTQAYIVGSVTLQLMAHSRMVPQIEQEFSPHVDPSFTPSDVFARIKARISFIWTIYHMNCSYRPIACSGPKWFFQFLPSFDQDIVREISNTSGKYPSDSN